MELKDSPEEARFRVEARKREPMADVRNKLTELSQLVATDRSEYAPRLKPSANVHEFTTDRIVRCLCTPADGVAVLDLAHPQGEELPRWKPGAHIDLLRSEKLTRQYSLCGDPVDPSAWRVGVLLDPNGRGGSQYVQDILQRESPDECAARATTLNSSTRRATGSSRAVSALPDFHSARGGEQNHCLPDVWE